MAKNTTSDIDIAPKTAKTLSKPRIFYTDEMFLEFEQDARRNLERELVSI